MRFVHLYNKLIRTAREVTLVCVKTRPSYVGIASLAACERVFSALTSSLPDFAIIATNPRVGSSIAQRLIATSRPSAVLSLLALACFRNRPTVLSVLDAEDQPHHRLGCRFTKFARKLGFATICIQHGGTKKTSLDCLTHTASQSIATWSDYAREYVMQTAPKKKTTLLGYPFSERLIPRARQDFVLLATCLHSEYGDDIEAYRRFLEEIVATLEELRLPVKVVPHPHDNPNDYSPICRLPRGEVLPPGIETFYSTIGACRVLLTRASTAAEEARMLGIPAVLYDTPPYCARLDYSPIAGPNTFFCSGRDELSRVLASAWKMERCAPSASLPLKGDALRIREFSAIL